MSCYIQYCETGLNWSLSHHSDTEVIIMHISRQTGYRLIFTDMPKRREERGKERRREGGR